ncbi:MAG: transposase [Planctomycetaceae bacterium]
MRSFFRSMPRRVAAGIHFVCIDQWKTYLSVIAEQAGQAIATS